MALLAKGAASVQSGVRNGQPLRSGRRLMLLMFLTSAMTLPGAAILAQDPPDSGRPALTGSAGAALSVSQAESAVARQVTPSTDGAETFGKQVRRFRLTVPENSPVGTIIQGFPSADMTSENSEDTYQFVLAEENSNGAVRLDPVTGQLTVENPTLLDFETGRLRPLDISIQRRTLPAADVSLERQFLESIRESGVAEQAVVPRLRQVGRLLAEIEILDVNELPVAPDQILQVAENCFRGHRIGTITAADPDRGDTLTYELCETAGPLPFQIDRHTGDVFVTQPQDFDFEQHAAFHCAVRVQDRQGATCQIRLEVRITDTNEPPVLTEQGIVTSFTIDDSACSWRTRIAAIDDDCDDTCVYSIVHDPTGGAFVLDAISGDLSVTDINKFHGYDGNSCELRLRATDASGSSSLCPVVLNWHRDSVAELPLVAENLDAVGSVLDDASGADNSLASLVPLIASVFSLLTGIVAFLLARARARRTKTATIASGQRRSLKALVEKTAAPAAIRVAAPVPENIPSVPAAVAADTAAQESQLLSQIEQLKEELHRQQSSAAKLRSQQDASVLSVQQQVKLQSAEIEQLHEELRLATTRFDEAWSESEAIEHFKLQIRQRNQLILELKSRLDELMNPQPPVVEAEAPFYAACELSEPWESADESSPEIPHADKTKTPSLRRDASASERNLPQNDLPETDLPPMDPGDMDLPASCVASDAADLAQRAETAESPRRMFTESVDTSSDGARDTASDAASDGESLDPEAALQRIQAHLARCNAPVSRPEDAMAADTLPASSSTAPAASERRETPARAASKGGSQPGRDFVDDILGKYGHPPHWQGGKPG